LRRGGGDSGRKKPHLRKSAKRTSSLRNNTGTEKGKGILTKIWGLGASVICCSGEEVEKGLQVRDRKGTDNQLLGHKQQLRSKMKKNPRGSAIAKEAGGEDLGASCSGRKST